MLVTDSSSHLRMANDDEQFCYLMIDDACDIRGLDKDWWPNGSSWMLLVNQSTSSEFTSRIPRYLVDMTLTLLSVKRLAVTAAWDGETSR